jgi:pyruvate dehydrogenase E1 component alpha subunit
VTYRFRGHSMADAGRYRTSEEVELWRRRDPIEAFHLRLERANLIDPDQTQQIRADVDRIVAEAVQFAEESPFPALSTLYDDVYCESGKGGEAGNA